MSRAARISLSGRFSDAVGKRVCCPQGVQGVGLVSTVVEVMITLHFTRVNTLTRSDSVFHYLYLSIRQQKKLPLLRSTGWS